MKEKNGLRGLGTRSSCGLVICLGRACGRCGIGITGFGKDGVMQPMTKISSWRLSAISKWLHGCLETAKDANDGI